MSSESKIYVVDASDNQVTQTYNIGGFINSAGGGNLAFASGGQLCLACLSGLYNFTNFNTGTNTSFNY